MKKITLALALFTTAVLLWACPYKSDVGIDDKPTIKTDNALLGTWHKSAYPYDSTEVVFTKNTAQKYLLNTVITDGESGYDTDHYEAWFSKVAKWQLITLYNTGSKKYSFGEVELSGNSLSIKLLSEDITTQQFSTVADMRKFIEGIYSTNKVLYDTDADLTGLLKVK